MLRAAELGRETRPDQATKFGRNWPFTTSKIWRGDFPSYSRPPAVGRRDAAQPVTFKGVLVLRLSVLRWGLFGSVLFALICSATATADRVTTSTIPVSAVLTSPCSSDVITFTGTAILTVTEKVDPSGSAKVSLSGTLQDPHAFGVLYSYNFKDQLGSADLVKVGDLYKAKFTDRVHFIRLGSGGNQQSDDLFVTVVVYATINSNLVLTVDRIDYFVDCK